jgi:large subunit ribosomal protein L22
VLESKATAKYIRTSAQKAGLVLALIRGKKAGDALSILRFTKKSVARDIEKALRSAIANAVNVADRSQKRRLDEDDLIVSACYANQGPTQKRVRPAPMGRAFRTLKRSTHISIEVAEGNFRNDGSIRPKSKAKTVKAKPAAAETAAPTAAPKPAAKRARKTEESK